MWLLVSPILKKHYINDTKFRRIAANQKLGKLAAGHHLWTLGLATLSQRLSMAQSPCKKWKIEGIGFSGKSMEV